MFLKLLLESLLVQLMFLQLLFVQLTFLELLPLRPKKEFKYKHIKYLQNVQYIGQLKNVLRNVCYLMVEIEISYL